MITAFAAHPNSSEPDARMTSSPLIRLLFVQGPRLRVDHFLPIAVAVSSVTIEICDEEGTLRHLAAAEVTNIAEHRDAVIAALDCLITGI